MNTFYQMWGVTTPDEAMRKIEEQKALVSIHGEPRNLEEQALRLVGKDIYEALIKGYTEKQWGRLCTELPAFIIRRLPLRFVFDNNYFNDAYQGIPIGGYNRLVNALLEGVDARLNTDFFAHREELSSLAETIVYTGPIDEFYDYRLGRLQYRTVHFEQEILDIPNYQGNAVVNFTDREVPYTRIIEHKHFEFGKGDGTVITREYPSEWKPGDEPYYPVNNDRNNDLYEQYKALADGMEPYYPVNDEKNTALYNQYKAMADQEENVYFGGRLAEYKYYDMAPTIERAMELANEVLKE